MGESARTLFLLRVLQLELYNRMVERLLDFQLTPAQYMVMSLAGRHGNYSSADFARRARTTPQSMNETIAALERKKLIERRESPEHRRILRVRLTSAGTRLLAKCEAVIDDLERTAFADFSTKELHSFRGLLAKALARFTSIRQAEPTAD
jgi:DNA-binding MarR family transcriptional regulator